MQIHIICAVGENGAFGQEGGMPWPRFDRDFNFFKEQTCGHVIVMGSGTWNSLPCKLPNRKHVVFGSNVKELKHEHHANGWPDEQFEKVNDLAYTLRRIYMDHIYVSPDGVKKVFVIGGKNLIERALQSKVVDSAFITHVDGEYEHDTWLNIGIAKSNAKCIRVVKRLESVNGQPSGTIKEYMLEVR